MLGRCGDCGNPLELKFGPGRVREMIPGILVKIPDKMGSLACSICNAEYSAPEINVSADLILLESLLSKVKKYFKKTKCKKSLYKSTYKRNAFNKGKEYIILYEEEDIIYLLDEMDQTFSFSKKEEHTMYNFTDYFKDKS